MTGIREYLKITKNLEIKGVVWENEELWKDRHSLIIVIERKNRKKLPIRVSRFRK